MSPVEAETWIFVLTVGGMVLLGLIVFFGVIALHKVCRFAGRCWVEFRAGFARGRRRAAEPEPTSERIDGV